MALLAGGSVAKETDWIERFKRGAGCDEGFKAAERRVLQKKIADDSDDIGHFRQTARTDFAAGGATDARFDNAIAALAQNFEVLLHGGIRQHHRVHRRREHHRLVGRQQHGRGKVVRQTACRARDDIRRCRRDQNQIAFTRKADMPHFGFIGERENIGMDFILRKRGHRQGRNKLRAARCQDAAHIKPCIAQPPYQIQPLIRRNAARNNQEHTRARKLF